MLSFPLGLAPPLPSTPAPPIPQPCCIQVEAYAALHKPFLINDLAKQVCRRSPTAGLQFQLLFLIPEPFLPLQHTLLDRRDIYATLEKHNVPVPPHVIVS